MTRSVRIPAGFISCVFLQAMMAVLPPAHAQNSTAATREVSEGDRLRGAYGPYRANNDLLYYHLDVRVDPAQRMLSGKNVIRFAMLEAGTRYCESVFVEYMWGKGDAITYINTGKENVKTAEPVICEEGTVCTPPVDQYKKGGLFLNTVRSVIDDDREWFALLRDYYRHFKYQTIMTTDVADFFSRHSGHDLTPIFNQYLRHAAIPTLELRFDPKTDAVAYRWQADEAAFAMPIKVGDKDHWQAITPVTARWQTLSTPLDREHFDVATDLYYVNVRKF